MRRLERASCEGAARLWLSPRSRHMKSRFFSFSRTAIRRLLYAAIAVGLYALLGFVIAPPIVRSNMTRILGEKLHRQVTLSKLSLNPFVLSLTAEGFKIQDPDGSPLVSWDHLYVNFQLLSFVQREWIFREFQIVKPAGRLVLLKDGSTNISDILN